MNDWKCWRDPSHPVEPHPIFGWPQCQIDSAAPQYYERGEYLPTGFELTLFVPDGLLMDVAPRSAIVGLTGAADGHDEGVSVIYYEGWVSGGAQYAERGPHGLWEAGVYHAADRMVTAYPTRATSVVPTRRLWPVGTYDPRAHTITITDPAALNAWLEQS